MRLLSLTCLVFCLMFTAGAAWADSIFVKPVQSRGLSADEEGTVNDLLKMAVGRESKHSLSQESAGAEATLSGQIVKLGNAYLFTLRKERSGRNTVQRELKVASFEEMDVVTSRLVRSVLSEDSNVAQVDEVTEQETKANTLRLKSVRQFQFGFGPAWMSGLRAVKPASAFSLGYSWSLEQDYELLTMFEYLSNPESATFSSLSLGMGYYFMRSRHSPFVMADFGYGWAAVPTGCEGLCLAERWNRDRASGWGLGASLGYKFFRTSTVNVSLVGRYEYLLDTIRDEHPAKTTVKLVLSF